MRNLNRMIIQAENIKGSHGLKFAIGWVNITRTGRWSAISQLWNGARGCKSKEFISYHDTMQKAIEAVEGMAAQHPSSGEPTIIVDDIREGDYGREEKTIDFESINRNGSTQNTIQGYQYGCE